MTTAIAIGEVMVELAREADGRFRLGFGGDTFNTAVYLARSGVATAYATALGEDRFSDALLALCEREGLDRACVVRAAGRMPGLYLIEPDDQGEKLFSYWRDSAPARDLFELPGWERLAERIVRARLVYLSGITLSLYSATGLGRLFALLEAARAGGSLVALDTNYRPRAWKAGREQAAVVMAEALKRTDLVLPTFEDEQGLWGDAHPVATLERLAQAGPAEIALKLGADGALVASSRGADRVPVERVVTPVDTTAAGDSFNAGYLAARLAGLPPVEAARRGHRLAAIVIAHAGALVPKALTEGVLTGPDAPAPAP